MLYDRDNWLTLLGYRDELLDFRQGEQINNHNVTYGLTVAPPLTDGSTLERMPSLLKLHCMAFPGSHNL